MDNDNNDTDNLFSNMDNKDPNKHLEHIKKIYRDLTGKNVTENYDSLKFTKDGNFIQDLTSDRDKEVFKSFIDSKDMELNIIFIESKFGTSIEETWSSKIDPLKLKRVYPYNELTISNLDEDIQKIIYTSRLEILLESEKFEEAAKVRDILTKL